MFTGAISIIQNVGNNLNVVLMLGNNQINYSVFHTMNSMQLIVNYIYMHQLDESWECKFQINKKASCRDYIPYISNHIHFKKCKIKF